MDKGDSGLDVINTELYLVGDSSLICQSRKEIDTGDNYMNALFYLTDGGDFGYPTDAFKAAAVSAASLIQFSKQTVRAALQIPGDYVKLDASPPIKNEYTVRENRKVITHERAEFLQWAVKLPVQYDATLITDDQLHDLFAKAGFSIGVGERRPQRGGSHGMFHVES